MGCCWEWFEKQGQYCSQGKCLPSFIIVFVIEKPDMLFQSQLLSFMGHWIHFFLSLDTEFITFWVDTCVYSHHPPLNSLHFELILVCSVSLPVVLHLLPSVPLELQWSGWRQNVSTNWLFECNLWIDVCWHPSVRQTPDSKTQHGPKARVGFELLFDTLSRCTCWHPSARWTQDSKHTVV